MSRHVVKAERVLCKEPDVVLTLPMDVARSLYDLTGEVTGSDTETYRGHADLIYEALGDVIIPRHGESRRFIGDIKAAPMFGKDGAA